MVTPKRRGMAVFSAGSAAAQLTALLRYAILARIVGPEQLGLAAIIILTSQFFEAITDAGLDRYLVQSASGNLGSVNGTVHAILAIRGLSIGCLISLFSGVLAQLFGSPDLKVGLWILALSPAIGGFAHFDFRRVQRHLNFGHEGFILGASEVSGFAATLIAAILTHSYISVAVGLLVRSLVTVLVSHIVAKRRYRLVFSKRHLPLMLAFGFPLMLNGILSFAGGQGDRVFIAKVISVTDLGHYSAIILLIFYPATMIGRFFQSVSVPVIASFRNDAHRQLGSIETFAGGIALIATGMMVGFAIVAPFAVPFIYGPRFQQPALLVALIGIMQSARFVRLWPAAVALATGQSDIILINGLVRLLAFPLAFGMRAFEMGIAGVVVAFALGEVLAVAVALALLHGRGLGAVKRDTQRLASMLAIMVCVGLAAHGTANHSPSYLLLATSGGAVAIAFLVWLERNLLRSGLEILASKRRQRAISR